MGQVIAIVGKGGTGKTTTVALLVRLIIGNKSGSVLAIDADPNSNLAEALGVRIKSTIGDILDSVSRHPEKVPAGMPKDRFIEYEVQGALYEGQGFDLLTMGRPEGPGCYCYVNHILRNLMANLTRDYDYVVIDNEAGLEHLSRRTTRSCDALVVITDPSKAGLKAAVRISELVEELKIEVRRGFLIANRADKAIEDQMLGGLKLEYLGNLPFDRQIERISFDGGSLMDLRDDADSLCVLRKFGERIWQRD